VASSSSLSLLLSLLSLLLLPPALGVAAAASGPAGLAVVEGDAAAAARIAAMLDTGGAAAGVDSCLVSRRLALLAAFRLALRLLVTFGPSALAPAPLLRGVRAAAFWLGSLRLLSLATALAAASSTSSARLLFFALFASFLLAPPFSRPADSALRFLEGVLDAGVPEGVLGSLSTGAAALIGPSCGSALLLVWQGCDGAVSSQR